MLKKKNIIGVCFAVFLIIASASIIPVTATPQIKNISKVKQMDQKLEELINNIEKPCPILLQKGFSTIELIISFWIITFMLMGFPGFIPTFIYYILPCCDNDELGDLISFWIEILG